MESNPLLSATNMDNKRHVFFYTLLSWLVSTVLASGCAATYRPAPLPAHHPASPAAPEAPPPVHTKADTLFPSPAVPASAGHADHHPPHGGH